MAVAVTIALSGACATSPPPLPPPRGPSFEQAPASPPEAGEGGAPARAAVLPLDAEAPVRDERYGGWTLAADLVSLVPMTVWLARPGDVYFALPMLTLSPLIHVAHGEMGTAGVSLLMRGAMLGAAYLVSHNLRWGCAPSDFCIPIVGLIAFETVVVAPIVLDGTLLARRSRPVPGWRALPVLPGVAIDGDGGGRRLFTLAARF